MRGASELGAKFRCHRCGAKKSMWKSTTKFNPFADPCQQQLVFYLTHSKALTRCNYFSQGVKKNPQKTINIWTKYLQNIYNNFFYKIETFGNNKAKEIFKIMYIQERIWEVTALEV